MCATTSPPLVSVVLTVLNGEQFLDEALSSVLRQPFEDLELIAVNDGSTDRTASILRAHAQRDHRVRVIDQENRGVVAAVNRGLAQARGTYVARLDADDISVPARFVEQVDFLRGHPEVAALGGGRRLVTQSGRSLGDWHYPLEHQQISQELLVGNCMCHSTAMIRHDALAALGGYRVPFRFAEDYDLWLRLAERFTLRNLPDVLVHSRVHAKQVSLTHLRQQACCSLAAQAAARIRRQTGSDPVLPDRVLDVEDLAGLGIGAAQLARELARRHLYWAWLMAQSGAYSAADHLLREGLAAIAAGGGRQALGGGPHGLPRLRPLRPERAAGLLRLVRVAAVRPALAARFVQYAWRVRGFCLTSRTAGPSAAALSEPGLSAAPADPAAAGALPGSPLSSPRSGCATGA